MEDSLKLFNRRCERLNEEISLNAPDIIIKFELALIKESLADLEKELAENR